jgi:hypothetical protein
MNYKLSLILAVSAIGAFSAQAYDGTVVWNGVRPGLGGGSGGAFQLTANQQAGGNLLTGYQVTGQTQPNGPGQFLGFCLETGEFLNPNQTYYYDVNTAAASNPIDPLDSRTAWLFSKFVDGSLSGVGGANGFTYSNQGGNRLQNAIWALEGEANDGSGAAIIAAIPNNVSGLYNVRVLNLWTSVDAQGNGFGYAQDMLVVVPEPTTYIAGGLALLPLLFGLRSRLGKK